MELVFVRLGEDFMPDGTTPLKNVDKYSSADVLCGRGGGTNHHTGNNHWRALVSANKRLYITLSKKQKVLVAKSIVHAIRSQTPGGRFLQKSRPGLWNDIGDQKATEKTSQALREGAPEIRNEMEAESTTRKAVAEGGYAPGQLLPNGLITLEYEGVLAAGQRAARGPLQDGMMDVNLPYASQSQAEQQAAGPGGQPQQPQQQQGQPQPQPQGQQQPQPPQKPIDPMMQAFQQFMGGPPGGSAPPAAFQQFMAAGTGPPESNNAASNAAIEAEGGGTGSVDVPPQQPKPQQQPPSHGPGMAPYQGKPDPAWQQRRTTDQSDGMAHTKKILAQNFANPPADAASAYPSVLYGTTNANNDRGSGQGGGGNLSAAQMNEMLQQTRLKAAASRG